MAGEQVPIGGIIMWGGGAVPTDFVLCNGQRIDRTTYSTLFALISTLYGAGDGSTSFNVPDLRSKFPMGYGGDSEAAGEIDVTLASAWAQGDYWLITEEDGTTHAFWPNTGALTEPAGATAADNTNEVDFSGDDTANGAALAEAIGISLGAKAAAVNAAGVVAITLVGQADAGNDWTITEFIDDANDGVTDFDTGHGKALAFTERAAGDGNDDSIGAETHTLTISEIPSHSHATGAQGRSVVREKAGPGKPDGVAAGHRGSSIIDSSADPEVAGGGGAHENMPPALTVGFIIRVAIS